MQATAAFGYLIYQLAQMTAVAAAFVELTGFHWLLVTPFAIVIVALPVLGSIAATAGSVIAWQWTWWVSATLFFGPIAFVAMIILYLFVNSRWQGRTALQH